MRERQPPGRPQRGRALGAVHSTMNTSLVQEHGWLGSSEQQAMVLDDNLELGGHRRPLTSPSAFPVSTGLQAQSDH